MAHYHYDCDEYCEACLPVPANSKDVDIDEGSQDTPKNCCVCGKPLDYSLTNDGVNYVLDHIRDALREPREERNRIMPLSGTAEETMNYYHSSRHVEIVRDWAQDLTSYHLADRDKRLVERFLDRTA